MEKRKLLYFFCLKNRNTRIYQRKERDFMNHMDWIKGVSHFPEVQTLVEQQAQSMIETFFKDKDDYAIEKYLKLHTEGLMYLERLLLLQRGVSFSDLLPDGTMPIEEIIRLHEEVKSMMISEANRQLRHMRTVFSSF